MIVKTRIRNIGEAVRYELPEGIFTEDGETVILKGENGLTYGIAHGLPYQAPERVSCCQRPKGKVLRAATTADLSTVASLTEREREAKQYCQQRADELGLSMRVTDMEGNLSGNNLICHFVAERRVDFRQLVRDMGSRFRCHVLMHQVPAREQARKVCGIGPCGRTLCCASFMDKPMGVSSQQARKSAPGVAHSKLTGACGKLMCCLAFDADENGPKLVQGP